MIRRAALALLVTVAPALGREGAGDEAAGRVVALKAGTLFDRIRQLAEPIAELDPGNVELEALADPRIAGPQA